MSEVETTVYANCGDCVWWAEYCGVRKLEEIRKGECRRYPYPAEKSEEDWCGEFELAMPEDDRRDD